ncbi:hypothetical protein F441_14106 [Phytophthora nicotianae CJ01A1]|uniref:RRM domain-containing protein n=6 Tax=Phytophthora nicotianae TaxID=4792 RepID=W2PV55_PHYN3|nr:hypothetical protein PPTG_14606 [Phytophthora nicotianae INRA-310]ETI40370.1 hypothetical protein F443_14211 [Phytophthora nicotianae P1569]ETK80475.1 hypothetical protein L915_13851 [Phytophthora nicotianae]ETO69082.1 hypothetical protein F444_14230 [Phytophthora nicotianae P1976]ETP10196.1 hypothetical protein F441_14106 [Phytophthora nicotianae CJ01A1]ETP38283.1 hypothetical protein F442_14053 [Phytophthora nicotianae P10297]KUF93330.1 hypothetical protein AM588_10007609 [Phytophthora n
MAQAKEKRKKNSAGRVKKDPLVIKGSDKNAVRKGHVVCVTSVPSALCASERTVRDFFAEYGMLLSVTIHHNFLDMKPDGFMYLEYAEKGEAEAAIAAVKEKSVGLAAQTDVRFTRAIDPADITGMKAVLALPRGEPNFQVDESMKDILLGRLEINRFSQSQQEQTMDEDDLILQSLSQHSFTSSQPKKKKKRQKHPEDATSSKLKKAKKKKPRFDKVALPTE